MESTLNRKHTEFCKIFDSPKVGQILITFGDGPNEAKKNGEFDCAFLGVLSFILSLALLNTMKI